MSIHGAGTPLTTTEIATEFPDTTPHSMSEFLRGDPDLGFKVPNGPAANQFIPTSISSPIRHSQFFNSVGGFAFNATITNAIDYNIRAAAVAAGWDQVKVLYANIVIEGVIISSATNIFAFSVASTGQNFPAGSSIVIDIRPGAYVLGKGGVGVLGPNPPITENNGATAIYIPGANFANITIINNGTIGGGGGGGGSTRGQLFGPPLTWFRGGGGAPYGDANATLTTGSSALLMGGTGGNIAQPGGISISADGYTVGGDPGAAVIGASNAIWQVPGVRLGAIF